jgi:hypothetical protein
MGGALSEADNLLSPAIGALIVELASQIEPVPVVLARYNVSTASYQRLLADPTFRQAVVAASSEFASLANVAVRIKVKSQLMVEMGMAEIWDIIRNPAMGAAARVAAFGQLKSLTGLEKPEAAPPAQKFKLTINLGQDPTGAANAHLIGASASVTLADDEAEGEPGDAVLDAERVDVVADELVRVPADRAE